MKMKGKLTILICILVLIAMTSCSGADSPSTVVRQLITAIENGDTAAINNLMTPDSAELILLFLEKIQGVFLEQGAITNTEEIISGDTAVVTVTFRNGEREEYDLVRVNRRWLVTINK